uniref:Uncharacterized protein n=1 Tax=Fagus sylvatica TaxID=28930 RepID=A0A2N9H9A6_FAGSY
MRTKGRKMTRIPTKEEPEGHSNTNATPPPPTPPKPEGKDSQLDSKIDSLEEKIRLIQGLNSFGNTDFLKHVLVPQHDDATQGNAAEWYSQLKKISHWKELADTFLAQYGFNSQIAPDRFDLQRMEKKSNETFREYAQKGERIEDALKTKKIVDMTGSDGIGRTSRQEGPDEEKGRGCANDREEAMEDRGKSSQPSPCNRYNLGLLRLRLRLRKGGEERISWRRLFYTLEKQRHITPLEAPPGPSTGDACEYHSGARGHSLECCEEFKKEVANLTGKGVGKERGDTIWKEIASHMTRRILTDDWGYFMEDDTDEWRNVDFSDQTIPIPMPDSATWMEEPYVIPDPGVNEVIVEIKEESSMSSLPALTEGEEEEKAKPLPPAKDPDSTAIAEEREEPIKTPPPSNITTTTAEEEYAGPMVEGLSIHTIAEEEDSTTPPTRHCQQGEEAKMWTCVPLLQRVSSSNEITRKTSNDPHVSEIDNKTNCSLDNIDNSDEEIELPNDILEALERQDEGSKPNIEELEIINLADEGEEPREVKIGTRCTTEQKGGAHRTVKRVPRDLRLVLPRHARPRHRHSGPQDSFEARMQALTYSDWVANIVPVPKKDGKVRMCVDYRDLNRASPKDNFPLPHIDTLVDNTATNAVFSFMDGFSGYNQIKMAEEDKSKTAFVTHWGTFVYDVMPFGLKNAGATYQRAMVTLFHDMIHHEIEVYVDDMIAKSRTAQDHLTDLRKLFQRLKKGIEIDPAKVQAIRSMPAPKTEKEIRSFLGRINYIARFIAQLTATCEPLFKLLRKRFQEASMGCMLGQQDETGKKEQAIYYLSKKFMEPETRYLLVEKTCCALAWASKKLRQYMLYYTTWLVSRMDPIKYIFEKPALTGKIARWQVLLSEFDILFVARKAIKGQAIADYLADYPSEQWKLYFDGAANSVGSGIGAVLVSPKGQQTPIAVKLGFDCTNNMTEYEACIVGLQAALEFGAYELEVFGDSLLIVSQTNGEWQARDPKLIPYQRYISRLVPKFKYITFTYTPRAHNHFADALATLASLIKLVEGDDAEIDNKPWYYDIKRFIQDREYPPRGTENEKKYIRRMAFQFFLSGEILYKRTHDATLLRCVDAEEANRLIQEMHAGLMGAHANGPFLARKDYESWLLLVDNGEGLHQTCPDMPQMPDFVKNNIICRYGMPEMLITDNASNLNNRMMDQLCQQFKIQHHNSAPYRPKMNGAVEAANKNVKKILSKMTETYKDWHEHLPYALCAYRTSVRTSVGATPYSLVYGMEAVLPVEVEIPSLRILSQTQLEGRPSGPKHGSKARRPRTFQPGDLVLKKRNMALSDSRGKFAPSYEGPYVVKKAFSGGAIILADMDGEEFRSPINSDSVIKYHV